LHRIARQPAGIGIARKLVIGIRQVEVVAAHRCLNGDVEAEECTVTIEDECARPAKSAIGDGKPAGEYGGVVGEPLQERRVSRAAIKDNLESLSVR
jgi:hypothetical protein